MASPTNLRSRRSAAQLHALAGVEREIRSQDSHSRRKYLREFNQAFQSYESVLDSEQVHNALYEADVVLVGDYHALPTAQRYTASLFEQRALAGGRPVVLGVETIFARDQHILEEWWRREIDEDELRQRIRFDLDWGYDWAPFYELLVAARDHGEALYGLDCMPREDLRKIGARDRHAAAKIAEIRERHPNAVIFVLFGESHLAPGHLPRVLQQQSPGTRVLTVLQNIDALYWRAAGERTDRVEAVRVRDGVVCVFNATPLEKYESYRLFLDQWSRCESGPDFAPTFYNLIESLAKFLEINRHAPHNGTQPKFLVDLLPEVHGRSSQAVLARLLARKGISEPELQSMITQVEERGSVYLRRVNAIYIRELQMIHAAENAARFLHHACRGHPDLEAEDRGLSTEGESRGRSKQSPTDEFYVATMEHAVAYFGSCVLHPSRFEAQPEERPALSRAGCEKLAQSAIRADRGRLEALAQELGDRIGAEIYALYLAGKVAPSGLRRLFLAHIDEPGVARKVCAAVVAKLRARNRSARS